MNARCRIATNFRRDFPCQGFLPQDFPRNDRVLLQRFHRPRRAFDAVVGRERSAHDRSGLPLLGLQRSVRPLCAHHSAHHGRGARGLTSSRLRLQRPKRLRSASRYRANDIAEAQMWIHLAIYRLRKRKLPAPSSPLPAALVDRGIRRVLCCDRQRRPKACVCLFRG